MGIREIRRAKNVTQKQIARAAGVDPATISRYEKGTVIPPASKLKRIAEYLNVPVDTLLAEKADIKQDLANTGPGISKRHDDTRGQSPDTDKKSALNEVLRLLRIAQDLPTRDVADKMGVRTSYITDVERGDRSPSIDTLDRYCLALGVTTDVLFRLRNEQIKENLPYRRLLMKIMKLLENTDEGTC